MWRFPVYNYSERKNMIFNIHEIFSGEYLQAFETFIAHYSPDVIAPFAKKYPKLKPRKERQCRFCKKSYGEATFKKDAHVMPQFIGNKYLIHDIECDDCNSLFSKYETSFASYIGLQRTTDKISGKRGIPKYKNKEGTLIAYVEKDEKGKEVISIDCKESESAKYMAEGNSILISAKKMPYIPLHVAKSLFKIGYSLLNENEISEYDIIEKVLSTSIYDDKLSDYCKIVKFTFPDKFHEPFLIGYKRNKSSDHVNIPKRIFMLCFGRFAYEFILLNSKDRFMIEKGGNGKIIYTPPYWDLRLGAPQQQFFDFSNPEVKRDDVETFKFTFKT